MKRGRTRAGFVDSALEREERREVPMREKHEVGTLSIF